MREHRACGEGLERKLTRYAFVLSISGVVVGSIGVYFGVRTVHVIGFLLVAMGVLAGGAGVLLGIARFPAELRQFLRAAPWRSALAEPAPSGRPWAITVACVAGFSAACGFVLALVLAAMPPVRELMRMIGWAPDLTTGFVLFGAAAALLGYWRMRRWGVWLLGAVVVVAPFVLILTRSPILAWGNLAGLLLLLAVGVRHYRRMS